MQTRKKEGRMRDVFESEVAHIITGGDCSIQLSKSIGCRDTLRDILTPHTIEMCNKIVLGLKVDDPAIVVQITDLVGVHTALGLPGVPVGLQQGPTPEASFEHFRAWLIARAHCAEIGVTVAHQVGGPLSTCWHHLSDEQATRIPYGRWHSFQWGAVMENVGFDRSICLILKMVGIGRGRAHMFQLDNVFQ